MCYVTAHKKHKQVNPAYKLKHELDAPVNFEEYINEPRLYTIEIEIVDLNYTGSKKGFFIPRLFNHTFNLDLNKLTFCQSWFMEFQYMCFMRFRNKRWLKLWLEDLTLNLKDFEDNPTDLFTFLGYKSIHKLMPVIEHMKNNDVKLGYRIDIYT